MSDVIRHQGRWYVLVGSSRVDDRDRALKHGETFGVFDRHGDVRHIGEAAQGLYHRGTRFLSHYELRLNGQPPLLLNSAVTEDNAVLSVDLTPSELSKDTEMAVPEGLVHAVRASFLYAGAYHERLCVTNYGDGPAEVTVSLSFEADFADLFEVRGAARAKRGHMAKPEIDGGHITLGYRGLDAVNRQTRLSFDPAPDELSTEWAEYRLRLAPHASREITVLITCRTDEESLPGHSYNSAAKLRHRERQRRVGGDVFTSNEQFNDWLNRSGADLRMLRTETGHGPYPYAGVPWFSTAFGRDGLITAMQTLWLDPEMARGVIAFLAANQARELDETREAEPGKILHETREGEMAVLGEIPFRQYYGTVDATPLFVMLVAAYFERTGDRDFLERIWPHVTRALAWIDDYGDPDGDGFVEYQRHGDRGLLQQGWKDSDDTVFHADGAYAEGPIALCEVQGYVYAAKRGAARLARLLGDLDYGTQLEEAAATLRQRFNDVFWQEEIGTYALALDGANRPCCVRASNAGHTLFTGIAHADKAPRVAASLLAESSFNGWGVRTLASGEPHYNPMSYHNGSVWPHDNAIIAMGLSLYGRREEALRILTGLFNASIGLDLARLPELFCGFTARRGEGPIIYPSACSPQAWAAGSVFQLLQAALGLSFSLEPPQLRFYHPRLPDYLQQLEIRRLPVANGEVDLVLHRHPSDVGVQVLRKKGDFEIAVVS